MDLVLNHCPPGCHLPALLAPALESEEMGTVGASLVEAWFAPSSSDPAMGKGSTLRFRFWIVLVLFHVGHSFNHCRKLH